MNDRDTFAAAALTGLISRPSMIGSHGDIAKSCYLLADAMLRERGTNHDAVPEAIADSTHESPPNVRCQQAGESRCAASGSGSGTGNTPPPNATPAQGSVQGDGSFLDSRNANEPVAWAVVGSGETEGHVAGLRDTRMEAEMRISRMESVGDCARAAGGYMNDCRDQLD